MQVEWISSRGLHQFLKLNSMDLSLNIDEAEPGMDIWFFIKPKDAIPTVRSKLIEIEYDDRGRPVVIAEGIDEWFPPYHFRKAPDKINNSSVDISMPLDDLMIRTGR